MLSRRRAEAGFTLIELLVSITVLGIIMIAISATMMVGLRTNKSTGSRIDESRDEQFVAAYFSGDAQAANTIRLGGAGVTPSCDFADHGGDLVVEFTGEDFSDDPSLTVTSRTVSYVRRSAAGGKTDELHRLVCTGGAAEPAAGGDTTVARNLTGQWNPRCLKVGADNCAGVDLTQTSGSLLDYVVTGYKRTTS